MLVSRPKEDQKELRVGGPKNLWQMAGRSSGCAALDINRSFLADS
jgi:hypothetical protein